MANRVVPNRPKMRSARVPKTNNTFSVGGSDRIRSREEHRLGKQIEKIHDRGSPTDAFIMVGIQRRRRFNASPMKGDVVRLVALDFKLWIALAGVMHIAFVVHIFDVHS